MQREKEMLMFKVIDSLIKGKEPSLRINDKEYIELLKDMQNKYGFVNSIVFIGDNSTDGEVMSFLGTACVTALGHIFHSENMLTYRDEEP
ncbi:hypothetical protein [Anaerobacterium chartisolvens]|nr:hypothetical protein [Anaerobacterium chartisolvens]